MRDNYDYVLIDCPPSLSMLTINGLVAADGVIIPMQCEYFALEGLTDLIGSIQHIAQRLNPQLKIEGLLRTMFDPRIGLANDVAAQLKQHFGDELYETIIRATSAWPKPPATACPRWSTTRAPRGPRPIWSWPASWSNVSARRLASPRLPKESPWL